MSTFDIASDAFASFKEILTRHKAMVADFLEMNYDDVSHLLLLIINQVEQNKLLVL